MTRTAALVATTAAGLVGLATPAVPAAATGSSSAASAAGATAQRTPAVAALAVPDPAVRRIPGASIFGGATQNLRKAGYTEREYRVTVTDPHVYAYTGEGTEVARTPAPPVN